MLFYYSLLFFFYAGCAMWGGRAVLHKVKTLQLRARCGNAAAGREGLCRGENDEGKNLGEMRREQGETKIPQSRGACGTRIVFC